MGLRKFQDWAWCVEVQHCLPPGKSCHFRPSHFCSIGATRWKAHGCYYHCLFSSCQVKRKHGRSHPLCRRGVRVFSLYILLEHGCLHILRKNPWSYCPRSYRCSDSLLWRRVGLGGMDKAEAGRSFSQYLLLVDIIGNNYRLDERGCSAGRRVLG